ncbi:4Fe-4S binding protein [Methanococcus voltae]|uniref:4Fe-4S ferredoxin-type domain-containing protein n=1 Tax=Methanococcus voltae (strain ATCC BAA-1334 / A3) TaxID=456320 RepID=D7DTK4_METV3|nr:4Fe-4S binding protein [Methanococcus voltae]MCS3901316.1 polyferredoxin [Methanococcus voltae]
MEKSNSNIMGNSPKKSQFKKFRDFTVNKGRYLLFLVGIPAVLFSIFRCIYVVPFIACDYCTFYDCPMKYARTPLLIGVLGYMAVFKVDFCAKICPFGTLNHILFKLRMKISKTTYSLSKHKTLKNIIIGVKYAIFLFAIVAASLSMRSYLLNPTGRNRAIAGTYIYDIAKTEILRNSRIILVIIGLLGLIFIARFWCRYLCPYGTGIETIKKSYKLCTSCNSCKTKKTRK